MRETSPVRPSSRTTFEEWGAKPKVIIKKAKVACLRTFDAKLIGQEIFYWSTKAITEILVDYVKVIGLKRRGYVIYSIKPMNTN